METVIFSTDVAPWDESEWPKAYATSPFMSTTAWVIFRGLSWALFVGHYIAHVNYYWAEEGTTAPENRTADMFGEKILMMARKSLILRK